MNLTMRSIGSCYVRKLLGMLKMNEYLNIQNNRYSEDR